jgi:hypothetical protein
MNKYDQHRSTKQRQLWMQIRSTAFTLVQLLGLVAEEDFPFGDARLGAGCLK